MWRGRALLLGTLALAVLALLVGCTDRLQGRPPKALFALRPAEGEAPLVVTFDGSLSFAEHGTIADYVWDFGDGTEGIGPLVSHEYTRGGTYEVSLQVYNHEGRSDRKNTTVVVHYPPPSADFTYAPEGPATGERVGFDAGDSSSPNGEIVEYRWSFGNGEWSDEGAEVEHVYWEGGTYSVTLTVIDSAGQRHAITKKVEVVGRAPCQSL